MPADDPRRPRRAAAPGLRSLGARAGSKSRGFERERIVPAPEVRQRLMQQITGIERYTPFAAEVARCFGLTLKDSLDALRAIQDPSVWRPAMLPGSFVFATPALARACTVITRLPVHTRIPTHPHSSRETTFVLDGLLIEDGLALHGPGSVLDMTVGTQHEIEVAGEHACLAVFFPALFEPHQ
jgi:hypothetical protein